MFKSIEGVFRNGKIELLEPPPQTEDARVVVTFIPPNGSLELQELGISPAQSADLRARLKAFTEDWDRPEMDVYDED